VVLSVACGSTSTTTPDEVVETTTTVEVSKTSISEVESTDGVVDVDALSAEITTEIAQWMEQTGAPAVTAAVILPDGTEITIAEGFADQRAGIEVSTDDFFRFASITKPMTSTLILQLVEEGQVELDEPVATYLGDDWITGYVLDGVDYGPLVTIRQILDHTDGFAEFAFDPGFYLMVSDRLDVALEPQEIIDWAAGMGPQYVPGTDYLYNTVGHVVAGLVVEAVTGQSASKVMLDRLFEPAGATDAYLTPEEFPPIETVVPYVQGELRSAISLLPGLAPFLDEADDGTLLDLSVGPTAVLRSAGWTGGGLEATALSTARIFTSMFDGTALEAATVEIFTTPWDGADSGYGLGISRGTTASELSYSHGGGVPGFRSDAIYLPNVGVTIVVSANLVAVDPDIGALSSAIAEVVLTAIR
jgi:D-alanyl-D-alanine carboxypeptidase